MTETKPEQLEHLDFQPGCELRDCGRPATHIYVSFHKPCFRDCYLCTVCADVMTKAYEALRRARSKTGGGWDCVRCGAELPFDPPAFRIEPL